MRTALLTAIRSLAIADTEQPFTEAMTSVHPVTGDKSYRFYAWEAPQDNELPFAVTYIVSDTDTGVIGARKAYIEWQLNIFTEYLTQGNDLAERCKELFDRQRLCANTKSFTCTYTSTVGPMRSDDTEPFQTIVIFSSFGS